MIRYLKENDVRQLLTMQDTLAAVEQALKDRALGLAVDIPRVRTHIREGTQHVLQAAAPQLGYIGFKYYYSRPGAVSFYVHLINIESARLEAIIEARWMGMMRTGAASGVATRHLARDDASIVGQIGSGFQSMGQLEAVCRTRNIRSARVFSRHRDKLEAYCETMARKIGVEVVPAASAEAAVRGTHIVNVITRAAEPVLRGAWLEPGQHINAAGSNALTRRELDEAAVARCDVVTVDARGTARNECGDLLPAVEKGLLHWETITEIGEVIAGRTAGRSSPQQITLYESHGMGIQDLYVCARLLALARERGVGVDLPLGS
ncbi:MAG: ornithine cyclodeaminase family protein [Burkholderiales bacterium]